MTDKPKLNVVTMERKVEEEDKVEPNLALVEILENMLNDAKEGFLQEMVAVMYTSCGHYVSAHAVDVGSYDPSFRGHLMEAGDNYREHCLEFEYLNSED